MHHAPGWCRNYTYPCTGLYYYLYHLGLHVMNTKSNIRTQCGVERGGPSFSLFVFFFNISNLGREREREKANLFCSNCLWRIH